jgi:hypothetical protein
VPSSPQLLNRSVFVNCPFDEPYKELFNALIFAIHDCGLYARCALETSDSGEQRFWKICELIRESSYGIHDLSRTQVDPISRLPRFNMPLELGLFLGARTFGDVKRQPKVCLVLDSERYRYRKFCSDLAGADIQVHGGVPSQLVGVVRNWLQANQCVEEIIPGGDHIFERYKQFLRELPRYCDKFHLDPLAIIFTDYISLLEAWLKKNDWRPQIGPSLAAPMPTPDPIPVRRAPVPSGYEGRELRPTTDSKGLSLLL